MKELRNTASVFGSDKGTIVDVRIKVVSRDLIESEHDTLRQHLVRGISRVLEDLPYTSLGIDNIEVDIAEWK